MYKHKFRNKDCRGRNFSEQHQAHKRQSLLFWGSLFLIGGVVFLLKNLEILAFEIPSFLWSWKIIFVILAIKFLFHRKFIGAFIMTALSLAFFAPDILGQDIWEFKKKLWPVIPIFLGVIFLTKFASKKKSKSTIMNAQAVAEPQTIEDTDKFETTLILSGASKKVNSYDFKGGKITTVMGGLELDLTNCTLSNNKAVLEIECIMGGVSLTVPREWNVKLDIVPIMGGVEDGIRKTPNAYVDPAAEFIIKGTIVMGGVEIIRE
jgi:predicted membrane protein